MYDNDPTPAAAAVRSDDPPRRRAWRARVLVAATALATTAALATAGPVGAQTRQGQLSAWISDGWGGGTVTSQPAGINCHTTAWDPYADNAQPQPDLTGTCYANFPVGTTVTLTARPDPGSHINYGPDPNPVTIYAGYNPAYVMFCPDDGLCSSAW